MEIISTTTQNMERIITWLEIKQILSHLDRSKKYYGVPRGGQYLAAFLNPVDTPEEADFIIDDLIDSGSTKKRYEEKYPNKKFIAVFNKQLNVGIKNTWFVFPWEINETPVEDNIKRIFEYIGEDPNREGLVDTPRRYLNFLKEFTNPPEFKFTTFDAQGYDEMITVENIPFYSLCEHHIAPFFGTATIAYIPSNKIVGLSKLPRLLDKFANKLQNQERITNQVANELESQLNPIGVAVSLKAQHLCMCMRGVKKHDTHTRTTILKGVFKDDIKARTEFMHLLK